MTDHEALVRALLAGEHRALARSITTIENRRPGYRALVKALHEHTGDARIIGVTGSPGSGKSTMVDKLAAAYRDGGHRIGVVGIDPSSPFTGGAVLGDRIRMSSTTGDMDVFFRSMSARGALGGLSPATEDTIAAYDAFGMDRIIVETVGAGQNEVDIVRTADTVVVLVQPGSGDDVQMLKAGILEIGDLFVVNKADMAGADRTVRQLEEMLSHREVTDWDPPVLETVATRGAGIEAVRDAIDDHHEYLTESGELRVRRRARYGEQIRRLIRSDLGALVDGEVDRHGGFEAILDRVEARETDPYSVVDGLLEPIERCIEHRGGGRSME